MRRLNRAFPSLTGSARSVAAVTICLLGVPQLAVAQGMPQLNFNTPLTTSQVVWGVLIFGLLYVLLSQWALPKVGEVLERRASAIEADLETARAAKAQADIAAAEMTETVARARAEAQSAINSAVDHAKQEAAARSAVLNERLEGQLRAAEQRIGEARASAMGALRSVATSTATSIIEKLTDMAPDGQAVESAVAATLAARKS